MNKIVKEDYPVAKLPEDLREGLDPAQQVRVTIEVAPSAKEEMDRELQFAWFHRPDHVLSLEEIFALRRPPFRSAEEIEEELRRQRDEWDE